MIPRSVQAYWLSGGPLLAALALNAFAIWAYFLRTLSTLLDLSRTVDGSELPGEEADECLEHARRDLGVLAAFTATAPLLGLLGTVLGMVETFDAVSALGGDTGSRIAAGIRSALVTTQFGLVIAIPGVFGLARLRRLAQGVEAGLIRVRHEARRS